MKNKSSQSGYTLLEAIMFIGVITAVAIAIVSVTSKMLDRYRISRASSQLVEIQRAIANRFAASPNYEKLKLGNQTTINKFLKDEKLLPADIYWKNNVPYHKLNDNEMKGKIVINSNYAGSVTGTGTYNRRSDTNVSPYNVFQVFFYGLSQRQCIELASMSWDNVEYNVLLTIQINGGNTFYWQKYNSSAKQFLPVTMAKAKQFCNQARENSIRWAFL